MVPFHMKKIDFCVFAIFFVDYVDRISYILIVQLCPFIRLFSSIVIALPSIRAILWKVIWVSTQDKCK